MKQILITTIAAVVLVGCGESKPPVSIHDAAEKGNIAAVKQYLADGTDVNTKDSRGETPLHLAAAKGHKEVTELLIAEGADVNAKCDTESEETPLHEAAYRGHMEIVELPISKGADVNAKGRYGSIALHSAAGFGQKEVAELLIAKGANVNAKMLDGRTPLDWASRGYEGEPPEDKVARKESAELLRKHGGKHGTIHGAAGGGDIEAVKEFLAAAVDVNAKDDGGETPLDWAIKRKDTETADLLRKHGGKTGLELKAEGK